MVLTCRISQMGHTSLAASLQTPDMQLMLVECWPNVADGGPTLNKHWFMSSFLLGCMKTIPLA